MTKFRRALNLTLVLAFVALVILLSSHGHQQQHNVALETTCSLCFVASTTATEATPVASVQMQTWVLADSEYVKQILVFELNSQVKARDSPLGA